MQQMQQQQEQQQQQQQQTQGVGTLAARSWDASGANELVSATAGEFYAAEAEAAARAAEQWSTLEGRRAAQRATAAFQDFVEDFDWDAFAEAHGWAVSGGLVGEEVDVDSLTRSIVQRWVVYDALAGPGLIGRQLLAWVRANVPAEMRTEAMGALAALEGAGESAEGAEAESERMRVLSDAVFELVGPGNASSAVPSLSLLPPLEAAPGVSPEDEAETREERKALTASGRASMGMEALLHDLDVLDARRAADSTMLPGADRPNATLGEKLRRHGLYPPLELALKDVPLTEEAVKVLGESVTVKRDAKVNPDGSVHAVGRRKASSCTVTLTPAASIESMDAADYAGPSITVNGVPYDEYFSDFSLRSAMLQPFVFTRTLGLFDVRAKVRGGGHSGQAGAVRHGISRALAAYEPRFFRWVLKRRKMLTRDSRVVEPKKAGRVKARKSPTWVKR